MLHTNSSRIIWAFSQGLKNGTVLVLTCYFFLTDLSQTLGVLTLKLFPKSVEHDVIEHEEDSQSGF